MRMNILRQAALFSVIALLTACGGTESGNEVSLFPIKNYTEIQGEQICADILLKQPHSLLIVEDKLLINDRQVDSLMHMVDLKDNERFWRIAPVGQGPNDFLYLGNMQYDGKELMINDIQKGKFLYYNIEHGDILLDEAHLTHQDEFRLSGNVLAFGSGYVNGMPHGDKRLTLLDKEGKTTGEFGVYPGDTVGLHKDQDLSFTLRKPISLVVSPQRDKLAVTGITSDWLAFYHLNASGEPELVKQYYTFETENEFIAEYNGDQLAMFSVDKNDRTMETFGAIYSTNSYFYTIYKGKLMKEEPKPDDTCYLLQLTWDGKLQYAYLLHEMIDAFAVDEQRNCIYATYTAKDEDPVLLKYELK